MTGDDNNALFYNPRDERWTDVAPSAEPEAEQTRVHMHGCSLDDDHRGQCMRMLEGDQVSTHADLEAAARELHAADLAMRTAQEHYRKALAAHMAAITGAKVEP